MARTKYKIAPGHTIRSHRIALDPTDKQATYFKKACGVARLAYNWALAEWNEQYAVGGRPCWHELNRLFNSIKHKKFPFVKQVTKCASERAIKNLGRAFDNFFRRLKEGEEPGHPRFKKKGHRDSFTLSTRHRSTKVLRLVSTGAAPTSPP